MTILFTKFSSYIISRPVLIFQQTPECPPQPFYELEFSIGPTVMSGYIHHGPSRVCFLFYSDIASFPVGFPSHGFVKLSLWYHPRCSSILCASCKLGVALKAQRIQSEHLGQEYTIELTSEDMSGQPTGTDQNDLRSQVRFMTVLCFHCLVLFAHDQKVICLVLIRCINHSPNGLPPVDNHCLNQ